MRTAMMPGLTIQCNWPTEFSDAYKVIRGHLNHAKLIHRGRVHAQDVSQRPEFATYELSNVVMTYPMPVILSDSQRFMEPNLPWAEDHFLERVSGEPLNPAPSEKWWPFNQNKNAQHKDKNQKFSHTYPERFWPKHAETTRKVPEGFSGSGEIVGQKLIGFDGNLAADMGKWEKSTNRGIRYDYGDLNDLVKQLEHDPFTRQAYLPVWFPEDTGAVHGGRVPCSLGYHFISRNGTIDCNYYMRSCDFFRHFRDDAYMAVRLTQWICGRLDWAQHPGALTMMISNLHAFKGDKYKLEYGEQSNK